MHPREGISPWSPGSPGSPGLGCLRAGVRSADVPRGQPLRTAVPHSLHVGWAAPAGSNQAPGKTGVLARAEQPGFVVGENTACLFFLIDSEHLLCNTWKDLGLILAGQAVVQGWMMVVLGLAEAGEKELSGRAIADLKKRNVLAAAEQNSSCDPGTMFLLGWFCIAPNLRNSERSGMKDWDFLGVL